MITGDVISILSHGFFVTASNAIVIEGGEQVAPQYVKSGVIYNNGNSVGILSVADYNSRYVAPPQFDGDVVILKTGFTRVFTFKSNISVITSIG